VKDTLKDAGSTIKDKVSGAADDAEGSAKSAGIHAIRFRCNLRTFTPQQLHRVSPGRALLLSAAPCLT
jgi:hypothetical protein